MPDLVSDNLDSAMDELHNIGVYSITNSDMTNLNRGVFDYHNWEVCSQDPGAGEVIKKGIKVTLSVAKVGEHCSDPQPSRSPSHSPSPLPRTSATPAPMSSQSPAAQQTPSPTPKLEPVIATIEPEPAPAPPPPAPAPPPPPPPPAPAPAPAPAPVYYANCTEARAAGAAPIYVGEPGYRSALDRDNDGIACE